MSNVFKFERNKNRLELEIEGNQFELAILDPVWLKNFEDSRAKILKASEGLTDIKANPDATMGDLTEKIQEAIELCVLVLDSLLGEGATKKIFKDNPITFLDIVDVIHFVFEKGDDYLQNKAIQKFSANRAQRRAGK